MSWQGAVPRRRASGHRRVIRRNTDVAANTRKPTTSDETELFLQCWARAKADNDKEVDAYSEAAVQYNLAVALNTAKAGERHPQTPVLNLLGSVTTAGLREYWQEKSKYASQSLGVGGGGAAGVGGAESGGVFAMSDADIDNLGKNALLRTIRKVEGGQASNSLSQTDLQYRLKSLAKDEARLK